MRVIGLMSGTSLDGVDACLVDLHGCGEHLRWEVLHAETTPLPPEVRQEVEAVTGGGALTAERLGHLEGRLARLFARAAERCARAAGCPLEAVDLIGSHGQTLWHHPTGTVPFTWQAGDGAAIAALTGVTTVSNFRAADVALGGQGAPLVPHVDRFLARRAGGRAVAFQNLGGIGNVTWIGPGTSGELKAFDTGPGNRLIDACITELSGGRERYDADGAWAAAGRVDEALVSRWLAEDTFLQLAPPRSTGREHYNGAYLARLRADAALKGLSEADLIATLTGFTAASVADAYRRFLPAGLEGLDVYLSGGGTRNTTLVRELRERLSPARVQTTAALGVDPDFKEAFAFAVLAYRALAADPTGEPAATGASEPWTLGTVAPGRNFRRVVLAPSAAAPAGGGAATEGVNPDSVGLDELTPEAAVAAMHAQDWEAVRAVGEARAAIARLVQATTAALRDGGRLFYLGAGTSGRIGVLDASECPPTFSTPPDLVQGLIAGGDQALRQAVEGAEDDAEAGARDLESRGVGPRDVVVGLSANGGAPYVRGALAAARARGATTALVTCNPHTGHLELLDHVVVLPTGPELVSGSTRLKAGTATKLALNMISTLSMVALGKVHDNLMVDLTVSNQKLRARAERLVTRLTGLPAEAAEAVLRRAGGKVKLAVVMHHQGADATQAEALLASSGGRLRPWLAAVSAPVSTGMRGKT